MKGENECDRIENSDNANGSEEEFIRNMSKNLSNRFRDDRCVGKALKMSRSIGQTDVRHISTSRYMEFVVDQIGQILRCVRSLLLEGDVDLARNCA